MRLKLTSLSAKIMSSSLLLYLILFEQALAYNLQSVRFLPMGDGMSGQQGVVLGVTSLMQGIGGGLAVIAGAVAVLFIVINGARMAFSFGNSEALSQAKKGLIWSIAGLFLVIFSYVIAKTVVSLVYSGEGVGTASSIRSNMSFDINTNNQTCKMPPALPDSCYSGNTTGAQNGGANVDACNDEALITLTQNGVCTDMGITGDCTISTIQQKAVYEGLSNDCSRNDGKYGRCTRRAIENYYTSKCGAAGGSIGGSGASSQNSNPRKGELINERQTLINQGYMLSDQFVAMGCEANKIPDCDNVEAALETIKTKLEDIKEELDDIQREEDHRNSRR